MLDREYEAQTKNKRSRPIATSMGDELPGRAVNSHAAYTGLCGSAKRTSIATLSHLLATSVWPEVIWSDPTALARRLASRRTG